MSVDPYYGVPNPRCCECGRETKRNQHPYDMVFKYDGADIKLIAPVYRYDCVSCDESMLTGFDMNQWEKLIADQIIQLDVVTKEMHRFVRMAYGIDKDTFEWLVKNKF